MALEREQRLDTELNQLLDDLARPADQAAELPGKRTRVEALVDRLQKSQLEAGAPVPGRRTLVERLLGHAQKLGIDDFRVVALRDVLGALGDNKKLRDSTMAAADRGVAHQVRPGKRAGEADANGRAMWRASERHAATLYRQAFDSGEALVEDPSVEAALSKAGSGAPLPHAVRRQMEAELGVSLDRVRVHTDPVAAQATKAVRAEAFTVGEDIFFADGAFAPDSKSGLKLLAHELAHVVQSYRGQVEQISSGVKVSQPGEALEKEADAVAERVADVEPKAKTEASAPGAKKGSAERGAKLQAPTAPAPSRTLQRKPAGVVQQPGAEGGPQKSQFPTFKRMTKRTPSPKKAVADAKGQFEGQVKNATQQTKGALEPLKKGVAEAKHAPVDAKRASIGKDHKKKADEHQKQEHAKAKAHHDAADHAKGHKHEGADHGGGADKPDPHSAIQFKKITAWDKYMPPPMANTDEREHKKLLGLVKKKIEGERAQSQQALAKLHAAQVKQANAIRAMKPGLQGSIAGKQGEALGQVSAAESTQAGAVASAFSAATAQVNQAAAAAKAQVNTAYTAAVAAINQAHEQTLQKLTQGQTKANTDITTAETQQITAVGAAYQGAHTQIDAAGSAEASHAAGMESSVALPYDGDKLDAAKKAAHDTAEGWAKEIPGKMQEEAQKNIYVHQPESEQGAHDLASHQKESVTQVFSKLQESLTTAHTQALDGANSAKTQALSQIDQIASSTTASLASQSASQQASIHTAAAGARASITKAGQAAQAGIAQACDQAATGMESGATGLAKGAQQIEAPNPEETAKKVQEGTAQLKQGAAQTGEGLKKQAEQSGSSLVQQAQGAAQGMQQTAAAAKQAAQQMAQGGTQSLQQAGKSASDSLKKMGEAFVKQAQQIAEGGDTAFTGIVKDTQKAYQDAIKSLTKGITDGVNGLKQGFSNSIDTDEKKAIEENAKKAADAVKPWWQKALAFVLVVVVAIVITVAVTALTGGLGTGPLMVAMIGIGSGALAGGLSSIAGQVVNNLVMGKGAFEDFSWTEVGVGALTGALTAGFASGATAFGGATIKAAMEGATGLSNVAIRTGVNFVAGMGADALAQFAIKGKYEFSMTNLVATLGFSTIMSTNKFLNFQNNLGDKIRVSVGMEPIHTTVPGGGAKPEGGKTPEIGGENHVPANENATPKGENTGTGTKKGGGTPEETQPKGEGTGTGTKKGGSNEPPTKENTTTTTEDTGTVENKGGQGQGKEGGETNPKKGGEEHPTGEGTGKGKGKGNETKPGEEKPPGTEETKAPEEKKPGTEEAKKGGDDKKGGADDKKGGGKHEGQEETTGDKPPKKKTGGGNNEETSEKPPKGQEESPEAEQKAHDEARDDAMTEDGYPEGTRETADRTADEVGGGKKPGKKGLRDTVKNEKGRAEVEKIEKDPNLTPEQKAEALKELAEKMKSEADPTGDLETQAKEAKAKADEKAKAEKAKADKAKGGGKDETGGGGNNNEPPENTGGGGGREEGGPGKGKKPGKTKTKGVEEKQLTDVGRNEPVPLTDAEEAAVVKYQNERNRFLKRWREVDVSKMPKETQDLLHGSADRSIKNNMTPDDLAAVVKEGRGVQITDKEGNVFRHDLEYQGARNSVRNAIKDIQGRLKALEKGGAAPGERELLQEKLGDLSKLLDHYESVGGLPATHEGGGGTNNEGGGGGTDPKGPKGPKGPETETDPKTTTDPTTGEKTNTGHDDKTNTTGSGHDDKGPTGDKTDGPPTKGPDDLTLGEHEHLVKTGTSRSEEDMIKAIKEGKMPRFIARVGKKSSFPSFANAKRPFIFATEPSDLAGVPRAEAMAKVGWTKEWIVKSVGEEIEVTIFDTQSAIPGEHGAPAAKVEMGRMEWAQLKELCTNDAQFLKDAQTSGLTRDDLVGLFDHMNGKPLSESMKTATPDQQKKLTILHGLLDDKFGVNALYTGMGYTADEQGNVGGREVMVKPNGTGLKLTPDNHVKVPLGKLTQADVDAYLAGLAKAGGGKPGGGSGGK